MKADLARREPDQLKWWADHDIYGKLRALAKGRPRFVLEDGPPYANGVIHIGHALNKVLKDIVVKSRTLDGYDSPYIPGWDCHGLPIELQVEKKHGRVGQKLDARAFRAACRAYAQEQIELQQYGYRTEEIQKALAEEGVIRRRLTLEIEMLQSPKHVEELATKKLHMVAPGPDNAAVIERLIEPAAPPKSVVAQR